jgi:hypothetical protein
MDAYWINPQGKILQLTGGTHIKIVFDNPNKFGLSKQSIQKIYDKYNENYGIEGKARDEIITKIIQRGYVRIREYKNRWSVQVWKINNKVNDTLWVWAKTVLPKASDKFADIDITEIGGRKGLMRTSLSKLASGGSISEEEKELAERHVRFVDSIDDFDDYVPETEEEISEKYIVNESSLSRLWKHNTEHDCGALTAWRRAEGCGEGRLYTHKENQQRNKSLRAKLMAMGYSVTVISGKYPEGGKTSKEDSYFVVDMDDDGQLEKDLLKLGEIFEQDSILFVPKGAVERKQKALLIGTNHCPNGFPGYGKKLEFEKGKFGVNSPIYTSYVNGRPFIFETLEMTTLHRQGNGMGVWATYLIAKKGWQDIDV